MFSKILIKLIDQAVVPAITLLALRIVSVTLVAKYLTINFTIGSSGFVFENPQDFVKVNSYSIFAIIATLSIGLIYVLLKSYFFHDTHISPNVTARLFSLRLSAFIQDSLDLYSQGTVWLSYLYLITAVSGLMVVFGMAFNWVFLTSLVLSVISTVLLIIDVENEFISENTKGDVVKDDFILKFE